ncbi:hypothetical protein SCALM49S_01900 [Streptomyces californicus]
MARCRLRLHRQPAFPPPAGGKTWHPGPAAAPAVDAGLAREAARHDLTREQFYFVLPDRFANGDTSNDRGGLTGSRLRPRLRPHRQGVLPGRRPQGPRPEARLHQGPRHHRHLDGPDLQEPAGPGHRQGRLGGLPRLLDHRLHPGRSAFRHQRRPGEADRQSPRQGHEGLLRRHHQPHRRHRGLRGEGLRLQAEGRLPLPRRGRPPLRRPRGREEGGPGLVPVHPRPGSRHRREGAGLAQRPDHVPQPGRLDLGRRVQRVRRLLRRSTTCGPSVPRSWTAWRRSTRSGSATSTSTASASTPSNTSTWTSGPSGPPRSTPTRPSAAGTTSSCSARSTPPTPRSPPRT